MGQQPPIENRIEVFQRVVDADPESALARYSLGKLLRDHGEIERAEAELRKAHELDPEHVLTVQLLGELLIRSGRALQAVPLLEDGIRQAHAKGEFQPRNAMQELLRDAGMTPPDPERESRGAPPAAAPGAWVCARCGAANARLEAPPVRSDLGELAYERVCAPCWDEWKAMSIKVINEYRLDLSTKDGAGVWERSMREFLRLEDQADAAGD